MVSIYQAGIADLQQITPLFDAYRQFYGKPSAPGACASYLSERMAAGESFVFLAQDRGGNAVGFVQLYRTFSSVSLGRVMILNDLYVSPSCRQNGVARALITAAITFARDHGALRLSLSTGRTNRSAQRLYEAMGWVRDEAYYEYALAL
jgi:GNAT superfamily N-acetyltransferase